MVAYEGVRGGVVRSGCFVVFFTLFSGCFRSLFAYFSTSFGGGRDWLNVKG